MILFKAHAVNKWESSAMCVCVLQNDKGRKCHSGGEVASGAEYEGVRGLLGPRGRGRMETLALRTRLSDGW